MHRLILKGPATQQTSSAAELDKNLEAAAL